MRILLDENVHHGFRKILESHEVYTVQYMGWAGVKNGNLLRMADGKFDLLITLDTGILYENDFTGLIISNYFNFKRCSVQGFITISA